MSAFLLMELYQVAAMLCEYEKDLHGTTETEWISTWSTVAGQCFSLYCRMIFVMLKKVNWGKIRVSHLYCICSVFSILGYICLKEVKYKWDEILAPSVFISAAEVRTCIGEDTAKTMLAVSPEVSGLKQVNPAAADVGFKWAEYTVVLRRSA